MKRDRQAEARREFDARVGDLRPELHRYCARMVGSVVEGEDVLQDALARAYHVLPTVEPVGDFRAWLFRIAHNKAVDHLRRYDVRFGVAFDDAPAPEGGEPLDAGETAEFALTFFLKLTPLQRSSVLLKDVLGHSLEEISEILDATVPSIKGALHRGRAALRELAASAGPEASPPLSGPESDRLTEYVQRFNARDFDGVVDLLADDVRLDLVSRVQHRGAGRVRSYLHNYDRADGWRLSVGRVEGRPAVLVHEPADRPPAYFVLLAWRGGRVGHIRDFRYVRYVMEGAALL